MAPGEQKQATRGNSLSSNYVPPNLENKFLTVNSALQLQLSSPFLNCATQPSSCPSLQPTSLSSTSSFLLSSSSCSPLLLPSPLLTTENRLICTHSRLSSSPNTVSNDSQFSTSMASGALLSGPTLPPSSLLKGVSGEQTRNDGGDNNGEETCEGMQSSFEEIRMVHEPFSFCDN